MKASRELFARLLALWFLFFFLASCEPTKTVREATTLRPTVVPDESKSSDQGSAGTTSAPESNLTELQVRTLGSLKKVDTHPLYSMTYFGSYQVQVTAAETRMSTGAMDTETLVLSPDPTWACSLYAALGDSDNMLFGRNFDWRESPAVLLHTNPDDGYASLSMVDIEYLGFDDERAMELDDLPIEERDALLDAPLIPFDGMNVKGLAIGMAAVPDGGMPMAPEKETIGSLGIIREMLDHAANVEEALDIMARYNVDMEGGPPLHYLMADAAGHSTLIEFYNGETRVLPGEGSWQIATNFLLSSVYGETEGSCWRYDTMEQFLEEDEGKIEGGDAMNLLQTVSQQNTQWSIVYGMITGEVQVVMSRQYDRIHRFQLDLAG